MAVVVAQGSAACIIEESEVDAAAKTFRTHTRNVSHSRLLSVEESCFYYVSPENNDWSVSWCYRGGTGRWVRDCVLYNGITPAHPR